MHIRQKACRGEGDWSLPVYADGDEHNGHDKCDSADEPPFKVLPDAAGATGNPHTCQQPAGDPHLDDDNPETGNPHNT